MKKIYIIVITCALISPGLFAQQQLENPGFETWENVGTATEEPENWSSLKTADALAGSAPVVIEQATGRGDTGYSVRMENKSVFGIVANGIMTNGRVHADFDPEEGYVYTVPTDARWNTPFTSRPDSIVGWFKYAPAGGDRGKVEIVLHKTGTCQLPEGSTANQLVARARFDMENAAADWTRFSVPFVYYNGDSPDYVLSVITSGDSTQAVAGSVAFFDDLELIYNPVSINENINIDQVKVYQKDEMLIISNMQGNTEFNVFDALGRKISGGVSSKPTKQIKLSESGLYLIQISNGEQLITRKVIFTAQ